MFTSPLGAPATFAAVDLTDAAAVAITKLLKSIFPRLKPMGLDQATGSLIAQRTSVFDRIKNRNEFDQTRELVSRVGFSAAA